MWHNNIIEAIGNTPLIKLNNVSSHIKATVLVKVEYTNPGNSIKDRIGIKMIEDAEKAGLLKPGGTIIEGTSGNTGMGLALAAIVKGYRCIFTVTDKQSQEKIDALRAVGSEVIVCPTNVPAEDPQSYYSISSRLTKEIPNSWKPNQYDNPANALAHFESTGPEIWEQTDGRVTHFVAGMGTCGTMSGVSRYLKSKNKNIQSIGIDTYGSLFKKYHETGQIDMNEVYPYITEGIGEDIIPENMDASLVDQIIKVSDKDSALMTRKLSRLEGLFVGWSSGSAVYGALEYARNLSSDDIVVVILPDHGTRYLGKVYNDVWMKDHSFLEDSSLLSADEIVHTRGGVTDSMLSVSPEQTLADAIRLMRSRDISQLPVIEDNEIVGCLTESRVLNALIDNPGLKDAPVKDQMSDPFPFVLPTTRIDVISKMITKECPAVIIQYQDGRREIVTKADMINALAGNM